MFFVWKRFNPNAEKKTQQRCFPQLPIVELKFPNCRFSIVNTKLLCYCPIHLYNWPGHLEVDALKGFYFNSAVLKCR